uniref:SAWADEE domain-containing protein n=1 Tax=Zea mays TaxID=4577 RepID=A0A804PT29_MAIZE
MQCGALRVMYEEFLEEQDEWYDPTALAASSAWDVAKLRARFCVPSTPLEDTQCRDLHAGARLYVSCSLDDDNLKFYDVVLDSVFTAAHQIANGMERCVCRFAVQWSDGPHAGSMEEVSIERVCCLQSSPVQDPVLIEFLDGVTKLVGDTNGETMSQEIRAAPAAEGGVPANAPPGFQRKFGSSK